MNWFKKIFSNDDNGFDPLSLDWDRITIDGEKDGTFIHVFNSNLNSKSCQQLTKSLIVNKYLYYKNHLPNDGIQQFILDIRGQGISEKTQELISNEIEKEISRFDNQPNISIKYLK